MDEHHWFTLLIQHNVQRGRWLSDVTGSTLIQHPENTRQRQEADTQYRVMILSFLTHHFVSQGSQWLSKMMALEMELASCQSLWFPIVLSLSLLVEILLVGLNYMVSTSNGLSPNDSILCTSNFAERVFRTFNERAC